MLSYLRDKEADMHADMAKQIFMLDQIDKSKPGHNKLRNAAKNGFVFPQFYGDYYANNAITLCEWIELPRKQWQTGQGVQLPDGAHISDHLRNNGIKSFQQFTDHMQEIENDFWNNRFRVYNNWRKKWVEQYRRKGYLKMLTGFTCSGVMERNKIVNYPIQGTAFHCLLFTFNRLDELMREENWDTKLIGQIHDDVVIDVHPDELDHVKNTIQKIVKEDLPNAWDWIIVPLEVDLDVYEVDQPWVKAG